MNEKPLKAWTFNELVDYAAGQILKALIAGEFRSEVFRMMELTTQWSREQKK